MKLLSALLQVSLLAKNTNIIYKKKKNDLEDKMCAYSYLEQMNINRRRARSSEQNKIVENVIVYVCVMMTLLEIIHFPLRITRDG